MASEEEVHRALANPVRQRILASLRAGAGGVDIQELAQVAGVHVNTVRSHLGILEEAGLVVAEPLPRDGPGRPRLAYHATAEAAVAVGDGPGPGYRLLAGMLAGHLEANAEDPSEVARAIGDAWGQHLVERPAPFEQLSPAAGVDRLVALLSELGFDPEVRGGDPTRPVVELRRCPFLAVARDHQDVVCSVHLGLMRGALAELGVEVRATELRPFVEPDRCLAELEVPV